MPDVRIVTVTLNPAIDRVLEAPQFRVGDHCRARRLGWYPGGKGINVSRVLGALGSRSIATGFVGRDELALFEEHLERVALGRVVMQLLVVRGRTRENITVMDPILDSETHIRDEGFTVQPDDVQRISSKVGMLAREGTIVVVAGSAPPGVKLGDIRTMLHRCQDAGADLVVDTNGEALNAVRDEPVWMLKLNTAELSELTGLPTETEDEVVEAASGLTTDRGGRVERVIATRGASGAILVGRGDAFAARVFVHPGRIANTVGCGDSLLAGLLHGVRTSKGWHESLSLGVAVATANAVSRTPGSISLEDVEEFLGAVMLEDVRRPEAGGGGEGIPASPTTPA